MINNGLINHQMGRCREIQLAAYEGKQPVSQALGSAKSVSWPSPGLHSNGALQLLMGLAGLQAAENGSGFLGSALKGHLSLPIGWGV